MHDSRGDKSLNLGVKVSKNREQTPKVKKRNSVRKPIMSGSGRNRGRDRASVALSTAS